MPSPSYKFSPPKNLIAALSILIPIAYYFCLAYTQNQYIALFQILFFFLPTIALFKRYKIQNYCHKHNIAKEIFIASCLALVVTIALNIFLRVWLEIFPLPESFIEAFENLMSAEQPYGLAIDLFKIALIPAICEEFFFRGAIQSSLNNYTKPKSAIVITALLFTLYHANPWFAPFFLLLGIFFGWLYQKTNNIFIPVLAHFINNAFGVIGFHVFDIKF